MTRFVTLRRAGWRDCVRLWQWRNDPDVREQMFNQRRIPFLQHLRWYRELLQDAGSWLFVAHDMHASPVGYVRLTLVQSPTSVAVSCADVSIVVAPGRQREGYGTAIMDGALTEASRLGLSRLYADVKASNGRSLAMFRRVGFKTRAVSEETVRLVAAVPPSEDMWQS